jgi:hypothetical protein
MFDRVLDLMDDYLPKTQASPLLSRFQQTATLLDSCLCTRGGTSSTEHPCVRRELIAWACFCPRLCLAPVRRRLAFVVDVDWEPAGGELRPPVLGLGGVVGAHDPDEGVR